MRKTHIKKLITFICFIIIGSSNAYSQADTTNPVVYEDLSLKDLLNVKIVSVSKNSEFLFDAPLSASVITKEEIRKTGCTSIMEALRLVPGMIVREQSNGNYDIHLRGMDNVPPNAPFETTSNTTTLVMIDNRPVYSYFRGGTFWETLPIDINDVERIEVIRGAAAALYGPNAVNGVINIITRQAEKKGLYLVANVRQGSYQTFINNVSIGYRSGKWAVIASGNYQDRERTQISYFEFNRNKWLDQPDYFINYLGDTIRNADELFPDPAEAMKKYGTNIFLNYDAAKKIKFSFSAGLQHSKVQKVLTENEITPLTTTSSDSRYADLRVVVKGLSAQFSYNNGTQQRKYSAGNKYDFSTFDASLEYNYTKGNLSLKPGLSYRSAVYDDTRYSDIINKAGLFNAKGKITTQSASLRGEYKLLDNKLRLIAGVAASKFNYPDATYLSYEFAATYKINKKHLLRVVYSLAPRSSNIYDTYVDQVEANYPAGYQKSLQLEIIGNKNLKLLTAGMYELGYRGIISSHMSIDVELFDINAKNYSGFVSDLPYVTLNGTDTIQTMPIVAINIPVKLHQQGVTVSLTYNSKRLQIKPFVTFQQTRLKNYAPYLVTPAVAPDNVYSGMGTETIFKATPATFGGASINYMLSAKTNINLSAYYYSAQTYQHVTNLVFNDGIRGIDHIPAKLIINANISYEAVKGLHIFCTGKNILDDKSREFFKTDAIPFMLLGGLNFTF